MSLYGHIAREEKRPGNFRVASLSQRKYEVSKTKEEEKSQYFQLSGGMIQEYNVINDEKREGAKDSATNHASKSKEKLDRMRTISCGKLLVVILRECFLSSHLRKAGIYLMDEKSQSTTVLFSFCFLNESVREEKEIK